MSETDEFERELVRALRRVDAPEGFSRRVLAEARSQEIEPQHRYQNVILLARRRTWLSGALAASLALGTLAGNFFHERHTAKRRAAAERQFQTAMRVTDHALNTTWQQVSRATIRLDLN